MSDQPEGNTKKLGQLISEAVADIQALIRQQIELTVAELKSSARHALMSSIFVILALVFLTISALLLIIALAFGFVALGLPAWLAFILDAVIFIVIAVVLLVFAKVNASKVKGPALAMQNAETSINSITTSLTKFDPSTL
ncbi:MAG: hypothetical protein RLZZ426_806 [Actinomycetota bacterium]|jgi:uncharacterized membrane protein YqjE